MRFASFSRSGFRLARSPEGSHAIAPAHFIGPAKPTVLPIRAAKPSHTAETIRCRFLPATGKHKTWGERSALNRPSRQVLCFLKLFCNAYGATRGSYGRWASPRIPRKSS
jgi:hypothetical protein